MKKLLVSILIITNVFLFLCKCTLVIPTEPIPSYIHVDSFILKGNYDSVGSLSHKITDVWVTIDNDFIGTFQLPATFPVLKSGVHTILLNAGIEENGIAFTRLYYPFYRTYMTTANLTLKHIDTLRPVITYGTGLTGSGFTMAFNEDFESQYAYFLKSTIDTISYHLTNDPKKVFEGHYSLEAFMLHLNDAFEIDSRSQYQLPMGKAIFMELNFKTDEVLNVGYYAIGASGSVQHVVISLYPTTVWKKVYINIGDEVDLEETGNLYQFFFSASKVSTSDTSKIYLDNIKLLYLD